MNKKLYKLMNWADIEEIIYSECDHPQDILGPHVSGASTLIQAYFPGAVSVQVYWISDSVKETQYAQMEIADEDGYFAVLIPDKKIKKYSYSVTYESKLEDGTIDRKVVSYGDPYRFTKVLSDKDIESFKNGLLNNADKVLGCNKTSIDGEEGYRFVLWAPNAMRVSLVFEKNEWDGRIYQMKRTASDLFELFIPEDLTGEKYQYEIKLKGDRVYRKNDPYSKKIVDGVSVVSNESKYEWKNDSFVNKKNANPLTYEISYNHFSGKATKFDKELSSLVKYVKSQGYNNVLVSPFEQVKDIVTIRTYYFAISEMFGNEDNLKKLVDSFHAENITVIFSWIASGFGRDNAGLENFDGTSLYEHQDSRQGITCDGKRGIFQFAKPEVKSFLISNAVSCITEYHADGLCISDVAQMLYLDYGKTDGAWVPNQFGGNENLDAIELIKSVNTIVKDINPNAILIAEDSSTHNGMTTSVADGGLGFDYKWNEGFVGEFFDYVSFDPIERGAHHSQIINEVIYAYAEKFMLPLSENLLLNNCGILDLFPGNESQRNASLRMSLAYSYLHPGFKLISEVFDSSSDKLIDRLNKLYVREPALESVNNEPASFEWLSNMNSNGCYVSFIRKTDDPEDMLIAVANFAGIEQKITTGVPYEGKYKELLNTDDVEFGGTGVANKNVLRAIDIQADGRAQSITLNLAPLSVSILKFVPYTESELAKVIEERIRRNTPIKKSKKVNK